MMSLLIRIIKKLELGSAAAVRLTAITGKADAPTHPKHLVNFGQLYYLPILKKSDIVLDLGSHAGEHAFKAAGKVNKLIGLDIDRRLISQAKNEAKRLNLHNLKFKYHDLEKKLPFKSNTFTTVLFFAVLEHLKNRDHILSEINRVLKPKGKLLISVPNKDTSWKKAQRSAGLSGFSDSDHKLEFSKSEIVTLLKSHKFRAIRVRTTAIDTPLAGIIDLIGGISLSLYKRLMDWKIKQGKLYPQNTVGFHISASNG